MIRSMIHINTRQDPNRKALSFLNEGTGSHHIDWLSIFFLFPNLCFHTFNRKRNETKLSSLRKKSINDELQNFSLPANNCGGLVEVKHGFKPMSEDQYAQGKTQDKKSKEQPTSTFIVPKNLEKKLHLNSGLSGFFAQKKGSGSKKCQKQNQQHK